jgi:hypothetical protein
MVIAVLFGLEPLKSGLNASMHCFAGHNPAGFDVSRAGGEIGLHLRDAICVSVHLATMAPPVRKAKEC